MREHASGYRTLRPAAARLGQSAGSAAPAGHSRPYRACFPAQARLRPALDPKRSCRLNVCRGRRCGLCPVLVGMCSLVRLSVVSGAAGAGRVYLPSSCTQRHKHLCVCGKCIQCVVYCDQSCAEIYCAPAATSRPALEVATFRATRARARRGPAPGA